VNPILRRRVRRFALGAAAALPLAGVAEIVIGPNGVPGGANLRITFVGSNADATTNAPPPQAADAEKADAIVFLNGDSLHGELVGVAAGGDASRLRWRHAGVDEPIAFDLQGVSEVRLTPRPGRDARAHETIVRLTNGDVLAGEMKSLGAEALVLETWYAGDIAVRRSSVRSIVPRQSGAGLLYEGPKSLDEWKTMNMGNNQRPWELVKGALVSAMPMPIGRDIANLPDAVSLEFVASLTPGAHLIAWVFTEKPEQQDNSDSYMLQIQSARRCELYRVSPNEGTTNLGYADLPGLRTGGKFQFRLLADRKNRRVALLVDNTLAREWQDTKEFRGRGKGISFMSHQPGSCRISAIRVRGWDGRLPGRAGQAAPDEHDGVTFANGDVLSGRILSIAGGVMKMQTPYAPMDVPVERCAEIVLSEKGAAPLPAPAAGDVRLFFPDDGLLTARLVAIEDGRVRCAADHLGEVSAPVAAFARIEFNLNRKKESDDE
jgi:hypothetical protein